MDTCATVFSKNTFHEESCNISASLHFHLTTGYPKISASVPWSMKEDGARAPMAALSARMSASTCMYKSGMLPASFPGLSLQPLGLQSGRVCESMCDQKINDSGKIWRHRVKGSRCCIIRNIKKTVYMDSITICEIKTRLRFSRLVNCQSGQLAWNGSTEVRKCVTADFKSCFSTETNHWLAYLHIDYQCLWLTQSVLELGERKNEKVSLE